ncbi:MAG: hypothetical protein M3N98_13125 [Actinomycetota bacterium]|nr:hypothetical protein [Actinomycetota bacterium]
MRPSKLAEQLGVRIRNALGDRADVLEEVAIVSQTSYQDLPEAARMRLGMSETQQNVLVRLVLRPVDRTLTDAEANRLRDDVYRPTSRRSPCHRRFSHRKPSSGSASAIHQGSTGQWAER